MDVYEQLAEIRRLVETAKSMPMSASVMLNRTDMLARIDALAEALPTAFAEADRVASDRHGVVAEGQREAERIIAEAHREREGLVADSEVYKVAKAQADATLAEAREEAEALRRETDEYVDVKLANFEVTLSKTLEAVSRGRTRLQGRSDLDALSSEGVEDITLPGDG